MEGVWKAASQAVDILADSREKLHDEDNYQMWVWDDVLSVFIVGVL